MKFRVDLVGAGSDLGLVSRELLEFITFFISRFEKSKQILILLSFKVVFG